MISFTVEDMTCGHCVSTVTGALKAMDPHAEVEIDLPRHVVHVETSQAAGKVEETIREAGYTPVPRVA